MPTHYRNLPQDLPLRRLIRLPLLKFTLISISALQNIIGFYFIEVGKSSTISQSTSSKTQAEPQACKELTISVLFPFFVFFVFLFSSHQMSTIKLETTTNQKVVFQMQVCRVLLLKWHVWFQTKLHSTASSPLFNLMCYIIMHTT